MHSQGKVLDRSLRVQLFSSEVLDQTLQVLETLFT